MTCDYKSQDCDSDYSYVYLGSGILMRNNLDFASFYRDSRDRTHVIDLNRQRTTVVHWTKAKAVQIVDILVMNPTISQTITIFLLILAALLLGL